MKFKFISPEHAKNSNFRRLAFELREWQVQINEGPLQNFLLTTNSFIDHAGLIRLTQPGKGVNPFVPFIAWLHVYTENAVI